MTYAESYATAKATPVKLAEMIAAIDDQATIMSASQRALVAVGLRVEPHPPSVRAIVALETAMEVLAAVSKDETLARAVSKAVAAKRAEFTDAQA